MLKVEGRVYIPTPMQLFRAALINVTYQAREVSIMMSNHFPFLFTFLILICAGSSENVLKASSEAAIGTKKSLTDTLATLDIHEEIVNSVQKVDDLPWINSILAKEIPDFNPSFSTNQQCAKQSEIFMINLKNLTLWAVQMYDSWDYVPSGSLYGDIYNVGNLDQCLNVEVRTYGIVGRYCQIKLHYSPIDRRYRDIYTSRTKSFTYYEYDPNGSVFSKVKESSHVSILPRNEIYLSFCLPSSCTHNDIASMLNDQFSLKIENQGYLTNFTSEAERCYSRIDKKPDIPGLNVYVYCIAALITIVIFATACEIFVPEYMGKNMTGCITVFSIIRNSHKLNEKKSDELSIVSGLKILFTFILIYGHRYFGIHAMPVTNREELEQRNVNVAETLYLNGPIIVNIFIVISGFLSFSKIINDVKKNRKVEIFSNIVRRWFRFTPMLLFALGTYTYVFSSFQDRLIYVEKKFLQSCYTTWWTHLLYVQNYVLTDNQCLLTGWYLAMEMQLYIFSLLVGYVYQKSKVQGLKLLFGSFALSIFIPGIAVYYYQYEGVPKLYIRGIQPTPQSPEIQRLYFSSHTRAVSYITGMLGAVVHHKLKEMNYKFSNVTVTISIIGIVATPILLIIASHALHNPNYTYNVWYHVIYACSDRLIWSLIFMYTIILHSTSGFGNINDIINREIYGKVNKLTFGAMLIHPLVQFYSFSMARTPTNASHFNVHWMSFADITLTYIFSLFLYLILESPFETITNYILSNFIFSKRKLTKTQ